MRGFDLNLKFVQKMNRIIPYCSRSIISKNCILSRSISFSGHHQLSSFINVRNYISAFKNCTSALNVNKHSMSSSSMRLQRIYFNRSLLSQHLSTTNSVSGFSNPHPPPLEVSKKQVAYWYFFSAFLVFGIVLLGGVTRLTESGLSIVEWNLIRGMKPPTNDKEWEAEFEKYKDFPEYKLYV
jgi:hypothetical protein